MQSILAVLIYLIFTSLGNCDVQSLQDMESGKYYNKIENVQQNQVKSITNNRQSISNNRFNGPIGNRLASKFELGIGMANERSKFEFLTANTASVLSYDNMVANQGFIDMKYKSFTRGIDNFFIYIQGNLGSTKKGEVRDNDVTNFQRMMSYHNLLSHNNQIQVGFGYTTDMIQIDKLLDRHIFTLDVSYFRKAITAKSHANGYYAYRNTSMSYYYDSENDQKTSSIFEGISIGGKIEKIFDKYSSMSLSLHGLITSYTASNYWRARDIRWGMRSAKSELNGFNFRAEYLTNISNHIDLSLFTYYQQIKAKNLIETQEMYTLDTNYENNYASYRSYGIGAGLKFW
ncbi:hypothetical protein [Candidatus Deianiraea vastatrix]|uniref:Uncharacterized protein n=1 Tax=Candidatus Deianiraea vastatrix TaxID=2163644 RepID=A0A5B8XE00_9RICK|nr:hypothetical protein [Candidatus Deianiraea vastatrix]QED23095.1 hypothetical protein Deia_00288 [Candidatus Deianiraea vastatrix]